MTMQLNNGKRSNKPVDKLQFQGLREALVKHLRKKGITDELVLKAMMEVPRHFFFDEEFAHLAYEDRAFPIDAHQTISQPYTVAFQSQLLQVKKDDKILEVGTGSMYQATILAAMGAKVFSIERQRVLFDKTKDFVLRAKYSTFRLKFFYGDGFKGLPTYAPFDKIIITCGAPFVPPALIDQLKPGGIMVVPLAEDQHHRMIRIIKQADGSLMEEQFSNFSFVPMLPGTQNH